MQQIPLKTIGTMTYPSDHKHEETQKEHMRTSSELPFTKEFLGPRGRAIFITRKGR